MTQRVMYPGLYWDEEKNKYFAIQPDHNAPSNAKYSASNVAREEDRAKRIKSAQDDDRERRKQTVVRSWSQSHPLLIGTGLQRELGTSQRPRHEISLSKAVVQRLRCSRTTVEIAGFDRSDIRVNDFITLPNASQSVMSVCHNGQSFALYDLPTPPPGQSHFTFDKPPSVAYNADSMSISVNRVQNTDIVLACSSQALYSRANVHLVPIIPEDTDPDRLDEAWVRATSLGFSTQSLFFGEPHCIGAFGDCIWDSAVHSQTQNYAFAGSKTMSVYNLNTTAGFQKLAMLSLGEDVESFHCDWLGSNTLAFSTKTQYNRRTKKMRITSPPPSFGRSNRANSSSSLPQTVTLWDIRADATTARLTSNSTITGLRVIDYDPAVDVVQGNKILLSCSRGFELHDLRFTKPHTEPVLTIEHKNAFSNLSFAVLRGPASVIATVDRMGDVLTYSLATGETLRKLRVRHNGNGTLKTTGLRWCKDEHDVPLLQACVGKTVLKWSWKDNGDV